MAVISLSSPLPLPPRHAMNLPSLPSEVLNITASYPSWQPFHTITPPWSSKPHHPTMPTLPPITSLQRQYHYRDTARSFHFTLPFPFIAQTKSSQCHLLQLSTHLHNPTSRLSLLLPWTRRGLHPMQPTLPGHISRQRPLQTMYPLKNTSRAGSATHVHVLLNTRQRTPVK